MVTESNEVKGLGVYAAISAVSEEISKVGIAKDKRNDVQKFNFRGIDDVQNAISPLLAKHKLVILPRVISRDVIERLAKSGGALFFVTVEVEFDLVSAIDGSRHSVKTFGEAQDSGDKATNKALSAAYKYMAIQVFCIPVEGQDDADADPEPEVLPVVPVEKISEDSALTLATMISDANLDAARLLKFYKVEKIIDLTLAQSKHAFEQVEKASKKVIAPEVNK